MQYHIIFYSNGEIWKTNWVGGVHFLCMFHWFSKTEHCSEHYNSQIFPNNGRIPSVCNKSFELILHLFLNARKKIAILFNSFFFTRFHRDAITNAISLHYWLWELHIFIVVDVLSCITNGRNTFAKRDIACDQVLNVFN